MTAISSTSKAPKAEDTGSTKTQLLDAAETLFERNGIRGTSLRAITERASANIASVNYHFGSKRELIQAVLARRLDPLNAERLELLDALEERGEFDLEEVFVALIAPAVRQPELYPGLRLIARMHFEPDPSIAELVQQPFVEVQRRFLAAMQVAAPSLSESSLLWRLSFAVGAVAATIANLERLRNGLVLADRLPKGAARSIAAIANDHDAVIKQLTRFVAGGMLAEEVQSSKPKLLGKKQSKARRAKS